MIDDRKGPKEAQGHRVKKTTRGVNERNVARCRMQIELSRARSKFCLSRFRGGRNLDESASLEECGCFEEGVKKNMKQQRTAFAVHAHM